jgi:hypothetical protein
VERESLVNLQLGLECLLCKKKCIYIHLSQCIIVVRLEKGCGGLEKEKREGVVVMTLRE